MKGWWRVGWERWEKWGRSGRRGSVIDLYWSRDRNGKKRVQTAWAIVGRERAELRNGLRKDIERERCASQCRWLISSPPHLSPSHPLILIFLAALVGPGGLPPSHAQGPRPLRPRVLGCGRCSSPFLFPLVFLLYEAYSVLCRFTIK